jgi:hypothetical protein
VGNDNDGGQNNQQNQQGGKNKGGGGGGGAKGLNLGASFDASTAGSIGDIKKQAVGHAANAGGFIIGMFGAALLYNGIKKIFKMEDAPAPQGGCGVNPGQLTGAMFQLKKSDPDKFSEIMGKLNQSQSSQPSGNMMKMQDNAQDNNPVPVKTDDQKKK